MLSGWLAHNFAEIEEAFARMEFVGPQDEFAAEILDLMDRHAVGIRALA